MNILVIHKSEFSNMRYDVAIDHAEHAVVYFGEQAYLDNVPANLRCTKVCGGAEEDLGAALDKYLSSAVPIDRIIARHELLIELAAEMRLKYGIPGMLPDTAINFRSKVRMKEVLSEAGIPVPRFIDAHAYDQIGWTGRTIIKPKDGSASRGVIDFASVDAAVEHLTHLDPSTLSQLEVEEFIEGQIWHVDGYLHDGEVVVAGTSRYFGTCLEFMDGRPFGSIQCDNSELESLAIRCVKALGGVTLTFHLEAIESSRGFIFLEVAARAGGGYIVEMLERRTGTHLHTLAVASEVKGSVDEQFVSSAENGYVYGDFMYPGHIYEGVPVRVDTAALSMADTNIVKHVVNENVPLTTSATYRPKNLPFSGVVQGRTSEAVIEDIKAIFDTTAITPVES
ncbi:ATP-grasp domain-containing protein [Pseudomonas sp. S1_E04]